MGIELTTLGRQNLHTVQRNAIEAETALSMGIVADKNGTVVEAMSYYYNAVSFDSSLKEVGSRLSVITSEVSSGNIGANVRNDIQHRNKWKKILDEAEAFFKAHLPFEIIYNTTLTQGRVNYQRETVDLACSLQVRSTESFKVLENILTGLSATEKRLEWGFAQWPIGSTIFPVYVYDPYQYTYRVQNFRSRSSKTNFKIVTALINENDKTISTTQTDISMEVEFKLFHDSYGSSNNHIGFDADGAKYVDINQLIAMPKNEDVIFRNINANEITDNITVKIISVNGINAETAGATGYIRISSKN